MILGGEPTECGSDADSSVAITATAVSICETGPAAGRAWDTNAVDIFDGPGSAVAVSNADLVAAARRTTGTTVARVNVCVCAGVTAANGTSPDRAMAILTAFLAGAVCAEVFARLPALAGAIVTKLVGAANVAAAATIVSVVA